MRDAVAPPWMPTLPPPLDVAAGGLRWRVRAWGGFEAPPLLLLHGFGADSRVWASVAERLADRWRVLAVDLPGHGGTTAPGPAWDLPRTALALAALWPLLEDRPAVVLGYSLGGRLALHLALHAPLAGLVVVGASPGLREAAARADRLAADRRWIARLADGLPAFWAAWDQQPVFATRLDRPSFDRAFPDFVRGEQAPAGLAAAMAAFGLGRMAPLHDRLRALATPTVVVAGERDEKFLALGRDLAAALPAATFLPAPGAGHDVPNESPDTLVRALELLSAPAGERSAASLDTKGPPR
ncbi:MAG: alpha/beta fold hydrolase [Candidatus Sericytochromatia bacterium]|nr:alpha/beta fold hydrolase [Candidatus Sericytochromatia bacterium]